MSRVSYNHTHIYKAVNQSRRVYKCQVERCPHSINASLMIGREAQCAECRNKLTITTDHLRRLTITCIGCGKGPYSKSETSLPETTLPEEPQKPFNVESLLDRVKRII